jgi:exopolysaccharide production protein ExoZ
MLNSIQVARGLACLLVLFSHGAAIIALDKYFGKTIFSGALRIGDIGVDLFFVVSGFIIFEIHAGDIGRPRRILGYLKKRFVRIYPYYWIYLFGLVILAWTGAVGEAMRFDPISLIDFATLVDVASRRNPLPVAWSLYYEVAFYACFALLIVNKRIGIAVAIVVCGAVVSRIAYDTLRGEFPPLWNDVTLTYYLVLEFLVGFLVWRYSSALSRQMSWFAVACGVGCTIATVVLVDFMCGREAWPPMRTIYGLDFGLVMVGIINIERRKFVWFPRLLRYIGDASYTIYLAHFPLLSLLCKIIVSVPIMKDINIIFIYTMLTAATFLISVALYEFAEKPLLQSIRRFGLSRTGGESLRAGLQRTPQLNP